ncbi:small-conductance mechanosensitive channel [Xenococcus sp. PCC 7305]|uniref:mechanosensitive ion channel family protein n=1 Tax=Xenococcus sp. PCC 7305 TaxID=102125 RepID=UPI0002ABA8AE|nr:mechanosensitive ion channel family protein [Xenococcus sp. PCC 7305]ELS04136.1 small-conductance mechanosensitive channel [Xenococcus sp. PCC 7305]
MFFSLPRLKFWLIIVLIVGLTYLTSPLRAQTSSPVTNTLGNSASVATKNVSTFLPALSRLSNSSETLSTEWIRLDGRRLFKISAAKELLPERVQTIQNHLAQISTAYFQNSSNSPQVNVLTVNDLPTININGQYLLTVTELDAKQRVITTHNWAIQLSEILQQSLIKAKQERQPRFLLRQGAITCGTLFAIAIVNWLLLKQRRRIQLRETKGNNSNTGTTNARSIQQKFHQNLKAFENRLLLYVQVLLCLGGILFCLNLFPYTRPLQVTLLSALTIPIVIGFVILGVSLAIRLSYVFIDRFVSSIRINPFLSAIAIERAELRISTIVSAIKWIVIICWLILGLILSLIILGADVAPLIAGAGLLGVAVSLASQNLIKDVINGFLVVFEDQYGIGDVIDTGTWSGMVEELNLRITQLRNAEGKLITIPNSQITAVANLTKSWARVDLNIPVAYNTDIKKAIKIIEATAWEMSQDPQWQWRIIEEPQLMGIEDFSDRAILVKLWIKTKPLEKVNVAREYRLRIKLAFDEAGIIIPVPKYFNKE